MEGLKRMRGALFDDSNPANPFAKNSIWQAYMWKLVMTMCNHFTRVSTLGEHVSVPSHSNELLLLLAARRGLVRVFKPSEQQVRPLMLRTPACVVVSRRQIRPHAFRRKRLP